MKCDKLKNLAMNDNGFVFDPSSGYSYTVNPSGLLMLKLLAQDKTREEIFSTLENEYNISEDLFNSDYEHYLLMLEALDLVEYR